MAQSPNLTFGDTNVFIRQSDFESALDAYIESPSDANRGVALDYLMEIVAILSLTPSALVGAPGEIVWYALDTLLIISDVR